jgi:phosphatidylserine/phosphatidylglycerophosphate/cardiolipin synthase-like enzyme
VVTAAAAALAALLAHHFYKKRDSGNLEVRFCTNVFVHEKLYIGNDKAITGSANLTYNGLHKNIEHIEVINSIERIGKLKSHFNDLWSKLAFD